MSISNILIRIVFVLIVFAQFLTAQTSSNSTINGFIFDKSTGESLIGANVYLKEIELGSTTNNSGYFVIPKVPVGKYTLLISYIGYTTESKQVTVDGKQTRSLKINLTPIAYQENEIVVRADSISLGDKTFAKPVSNIEMNSKQVNQIPKIIEADLLRALQTMPGITALSDFSSAIYVRGGTPDQNLYLIDGSDVYNPEHAFGIFSTFNTNAIKKVDVSKGGFGAEYGGRLSSVIDIINLDGNRKNFEGIVNVNLLSGSTTLQMPLGSIGSLSGSFRRTYIDQTYSKWIKEVPDYYFYDGNLKGTFDLSGDDRLSVSFFNSKDNLNYKVDKDAPESFSFLYNWGNTTGSANWKHIFNSNIFSNFWVTSSYFDSDFNMSQIDNMQEKNKLTDYTVKEALEYYLSNQLTIQLGAEYKFLYFLYKFNWVDGSVNIENNRRAFSAYTSTKWQPNPLLDIEAGLRFEQFNSDKNFTNLNPNLSVKYRLSETSSIKFATGIYHQYLDRVPRLFFASIWTAADKYTSDSRAIHFILGYQKQIGNILDLNAEVYYKDYKNLYIFNQNFNATITPDYYDISGRPVYTSTNNLFNRGDGKSYGFELMLRKDIGAVNGWVAYSLSRTKYTFDGINQGNEFIPRQDRTSVVNFVLNGDIKNIFNGKWNESAEKLPSRWLLSLSFIYSTGQPLTIPSSAYYVNTLPDWNGQQSGSESLPGYKLYPGTIDSYRLPDYMRMDVSVTWEKDFGSWTLSPYLQIYNIGNRKNVWFINYKNKIVDGSIIQEAEKVNMLPILPSLGVTIKF